MVCGTFNDSDDNSRLYRVSSSGGFLNQKTLQGVGQIDYEDIARAADGRYFIGDFGNNDNERTDLVIYITEDLEETSSSVITVQTIEFSLSDQSSFPPADENRNFDVEALLHFQDSLYLFTRNRTDPFSGWTKVYRLPDEQGNYQAVLIDSVFGNLSSDYSSITAADINPSQNRIALLTSGSLFILTDFENGMGGASISYNFFSFTRSFEGISFIDDCTALIIEEGVPAEIYSINTCEIVSSLQEYQENETISYVLKSRILSPNGLDAHEKLQILDSLGRVISTSKGNQAIDLSSFPVGLYILISGNGTEMRSSRFFLF
jgi:hypothetical protein